MVIMDLSLQWNFDEICCCIWIDSPPPPHPLFFKAIIDSFFVSIFSDLICAGQWLFHCWPLLLSVHGAYFSLPLHDVHGVHLLNVLSSSLRGRSWHCSLLKFHMMFVYWACTQFFGSCVFLPIGTISIYTNHEILFGWGRWAVTS